MNFSDFKVKFKRWFNNLNIGFFGAVGATLMVLATLLSFGGTLLASSESGSRVEISSLFILIINVLFYFLLQYKVKNNSSALYTSIPIQFLPM